jgi:predicted transposase/invertase (TIGR01784 family)
MEDQFYDKSFSALFRQPLFLRSLLENFIAEPWVALLDLSSMKVESSSFKKGGVPRRESDLLVSFRRSDCSGSFSVLLLIEFQSSPDAMGFRILEYLSRIYLRQEEEKLTPSPVVPVVLYNGLRRWNDNPQLLNRFPELPDSLLPYIPDFSYILIDESHFSDKTLFSMKSALATFFLLDKTSLKDRKAAETRILKLLRKAKAENPELFQALGSYMQGLLSHRNVEIPAIEAYIEERRKPMLAQRLDLLIDEGKVEGRAEGTLADKQQVLVRLISRKFGITEEEKAAVLECRSLQRLDKALDEILFAERKEVVLGCLRG